MNYEALGAAEHGLDISIFVPVNGNTTAHFRMQHCDDNDPQFADPAPLLHKAIAALEAELSALKYCPAHQKTRARKALEQGEGQT